MKKTVKKQMVLTLYLMLLIVYIIISLVYRWIISESIKKDEFMVLDAAASFASIEIDPDAAKTYITTRKTDADYQVVLRKILAYTHENPITRISFISYGNTVGYYIYDTEDKKLGTKVSYDDFTSDEKDKLIACREELESTRNNKNYKYKPVRSAEDAAVGYIIVESESGRDILGFTMVGLSAGAIIVLLGVSWLAVRLLQKSVFEPIEQFAHTAFDFTGSEFEDENAEELKNKFETGRNDEIGHLGKSIVSMINVIYDSKKDFSSAVFDATHDGMTKVFNKRHYENKVDSFRSCNSLCVIYFDVNNLKLINDTLGHERGDYVIKRAADYIREISPEGSMCFRMGGDEFMLVVMNNSYNDIYDLIKRLDSDCPVILSAETDSIKCSVAYGYAYEKGKYSYEALLAEAEENMYRKKYEIKQQLNMPER